MKSRFSPIYAAISIGALLSAALLATIAPAQAQDFEAVRLIAAAPGRDGGQVGMALRSGAAYAGSDERYGTWLPVLDYQWANGWFAGTSNGLGLNLSHDPALQYGPRVTLDRGRDESRSSRLLGWGEVKAQPELGAFLNYAPVEDVLLSSSIRYGSGNERKGLVIDLGVGAGTLVLPGLRLGVMANASFANASHQQSYFGVSSSQADASGLPTCAPGTGWRDLRAAMTLSYHIDPAWTLHAEVGAKTLVGGAKRSTVTRQRSESSALVALTHSL